MKNEQEIRKILEEGISKVELPENALSNLPAPIRAILSKFLGSKDPIEFISGMIPLLPTDAVESIVELAKEITAAANG